MAACGVGLCLFAVLVCLVVLGMHVESRNLRLRHGRHSHPGYDDFDGESIPRDLSAHRRLDEEQRDKSLQYRDSYRRRGYPAAADRFASAEYEEDVTEEERAPSPVVRHHRYRHGATKTMSYESPQRGNEEEERWYDDDDDDYGRYASSRFVARRKRQNNRHGGGGSLVYRPITDEDREDMRTSKQRDYDAELQHAGDLPFEMEVKEAQNSTVCNYTVISIRYNKSRGSRVPKDLEHVKCNHAGSSCQGGKHCCIQTYRWIDVSYGDGTTEDMKIYVGCVCARLNGLQESLLSTND